MRYKVRRSWEKVKVPVLGAGGAAAGLTVGELSSELTSRALGYTGYEKAGVKTVVKGLVGSLFFGASAIPGIAPFTMPAALCIWGSTVLDWIAARYPGGITGIADRLATTIRAWSIGTEKAAAELAKLEQTPSTPAPSTKAAMTVWA